MSDGLKRFLSTVSVLAIVGYLASVAFEKLNRFDAVTVRPAAAEGQAPLTGVPSTLKPGEAYRGVLTLPAAEPGTRVFVSARSDSPVLLDLDLQVCEASGCHSVKADTFTYGSSGQAELDVRLGISRATVGEFGVLRDADEIEIFAAVSGPDSIWNPFDEDFPEEIPLGTFALDKSSP